MTLATFSSSLRLACASGALALTAGLFSAGCSADAGGPAVESAEQTAQAVVAYPPFGYPCLGCHPCNDGTGDYCDNDTKKAVCAGNGGPPVIPVTPTRSR